MIFGKFWERRKMKQMNEEAAKVETKMAEQKGAIDGALLKVHTLAWDVGIEAAKLKPEPPPKVKSSTFGTREEAISPVEKAIGDIANADKPKE